VDSSDIEELKFDLCFNRLFIEYLMIEFIFIGPQLQGSDPILKTILFDDCCSPEVSEQ
jgi:hypothetical protein